MPPRASALLDTDKVIQTVEFYRGKEARFAELYAERAPASPAPAAVDDEAEEEDLDVQELVDPSEE
jgi:hypothetical protein